MRDASDKRRALVALLILALVLGAVVAIAVTFRNSAEPPQAGGHPAVEAGQSCSSCKAERHDYVHEPPYDSPDCGKCHTLRTWTRVSFVHEKPEFNEGFHAIVDCGNCHEAGEPLPAPDCQGCHVPKTHPILPGCANCHTPDAWRVPKPIPPGHVSLAGGHWDLVCFDCHSGAQPFAHPKPCVSCHGTNHGGLSDCAQCHDPVTGWKLEPGFDHRPIYPLTGLHRLLACSRCHPKLRFLSAGPACTTCHGRKHGGLTECADCHTTSGFKPSTFRHVSVWRLTGRHARLACTECHPKRLYARAIGDADSCSSCHGARHGGLTDCGRCHTTSGFTPSTFRHRTVWRLTGKHAEVSCRKCHPMLLYARHIGDTSSCVSCHGERHGGLRACAVCHTTAGFVPATFDHRTAWPLTGKHLSVACSKCHPYNRYASVIGSPSRCTNCHGVAHGNQTNCEYCHTTAGFSPIKPIVHPVFPRLSGEHQKRACTLCHPTLMFNVAPRDCNECHTAPHVEPTDCLRCHRPTVWTDLHFTHSDIGYHTGIPYEDACGYCHTTGNYGEYTCTACHLPF